MERLDTMLVRRGLAPSREKAKELIKNHQIEVNGKIAAKPALEVSEETRIAVKGEVNPFVSRGGLKLEKALEAFSLDMTGLVCLDIGASTGGFTDCMLQHGASHVYAIDVGTDQLAEKLRLDPRVTSMEQTNVRALTPSDLPQAADFASIDVSFISLEKVLPSVVPLLKESAFLAALIKPQFEAGRNALNKKGIVKDPKVHEKVIQSVVDIALSLELSISGLTYSPIKGPEGNIEYLLLLKKDALVQKLPHSFNIQETVRLAHKNLS